MTSTTAPAPAAGSAVSQTTSILWGFWGSPEEAASHKLVADAFMKEHPEIKVNIWNQPYDNYFTAIQALWAGGDPKTIPDVAFLWPTPELCGPGCAREPRSVHQEVRLQPERLLAGPARVRQVQWQRLRPPARHRGRRPLLQQDLFDKAGLKYPDENWTWDDLLAAAEKLTVKDANGNVKQYGLAMENTNKYSILLNQNGGAIFDDYRNPSKCMLSDPKSVQAVSFFTDLLAKGYAMKDADLTQAGGDQGAFQSGQAAMIIQNTSRVSSFNKANMPYDVAVIPIPKGGKRFNPAGGAAWVMSAKSANKDAAWTFIQWLQSANGGEKIYTQRGEIFPALQSVANSPTFMTDQPPANKAAIITDAKASDVGAFGYFPDWDELNSSIIAPGLDKVWTGATTPDKGLADICTQVDQFLKDKGYPKK